MLNDDTTEVADGGGRRWSPGIVVTAVTVAVVLLLLIGAAVYGGVTLHHQNSQLDATRRQLTQLQHAQATNAKTTAATLKDAQAQLATLEAQLTSTQNKLKADEKQLQLAQSQLPPDLTQLATSVSPSVVLITCGNDLGSGFALALPPANGFSSVVVTAAHVVAGCLPTTPTPATLTVTHQGTVAKAQLRSADTVNDVAIIDVVPSLPALKPAPAPVVGEFTMAVGNPLGVTNNVTQGNVSKVEQDYFLNTAPISSGNSGGPLVDREGRALGIADSGGAANSNAPVVENFNVALRLSTLCTTLLSGPVCDTVH